IAAARKKAAKNQTMATLETVELSRAEKQRFCSMYYSILNGYLREIKLDGDQLIYLREGAPATPLAAISKHELVYEAAPQVKFTFDEEDYRTMIVTVNDQEPMPYRKYDEKSYTAEDLKQFQNEYYNADIDETYNLVASGDHLSVRIDDDEIFPVVPVTTDVFTSEHSGYFKFVRGGNGQITGFTQYDDLLHAMSYEVVGDTDELTSVGAGVDRQAVMAVLTDYIEGTANGQPDRVRKAFHPDLNLYSVKDDELSVWNGQNYINGIKVGKKNSRQGSILAIDIENNAASAKVEIVVPGWRVFTDYFLLLKLKGKWQVIHKSYTWRSVSG
ncbi:MAG: nuclear transport factor 2 family protein, partial [Bacteroidota bacterium]